MTPEQTERLRQMVDAAEARLARMKQCHTTLLQLIQDNYDFLWHSSAHSGPRLFEGECHLRAEIKRAQQWINEKRHWLPHDQPLPPIQ